MANSQILQEKNSLIESHKTESSFDCLTRIQFFVGEMKKILSN